MRRALVAGLAGRPLLILVTMTVFFLGFGYFSINLYFLFKANIDLVTEHGVMALRDGAASQLARIAGAGLASSFFYSGFKLCEKLIVEWLTRDR